MTVQEVSATPKIEWDDGVVFVFSFDPGAGGRQFAGFAHWQIQPAFAIGSTTQVNQILTQTVQSQIQVANDPQSWLDTVKTAARSGNSISIVFDDAVSINYTTQTNKPFTLQVLSSLAG